MVGLLRTALLAGVLGLAGAGAAVAQHGPAAEPEPSFDRPPVVVQGGPFAAGIAAMKAKHYHEAAMAFDAITEASPQDPRGWELLGAAYAGELNWKASRKAYERAVRLAPDDIAA
ncbi:MAG: tetratricopeptide repeat protein, partial [Phenylobacterium sp.]